MAPKVGIHSGHRPRPPATGCIRLAHGIAKPPTTTVADVSPSLGPESSLGHILALYLSRPSEAERLVGRQELAGAIQWLVHCTTRASFILSTDEQKVPMLGGRKESTADREVDGRGYAK